MPVFSNIKSRVQNLGEQFKGHKKWKMFLYAGILILGMGYIAVEQYQGYLVVIDFDNQERINVYGEVTAIVDTPREK